MAWFSELLSSSRLVRGWKGIVVRSLQRNFGSIKRRINGYPLDHKLTGNPFSDSFLHVGFFIESIHHVEERFACIVYAADGIYGFATALLNRGVKAIELPSKHLSRPEIVSAFNNTTTGELTSEITQSGPSPCCRIWTRARSNDCIAPS